MENDESRLEKHSSLSSNGPFFFWEMGEPAEHCTKPWELHYTNAPHIIIAGITLSENHSHTNIMEKKKPQAIKARKWQEASHL